jgi:hypothetical protein
VDRSPSSIGAPPRLHSLQLRLYGGESGILSEPSSANVDEHYTSVIIPCVCAGYKQILSWGTVSTVYAIPHSSEKNGITGISKYGLRIHSGIKILTD